MISANGCTYLPLLPLAQSLHDFVAISLFFNGRQRIFQLKSFLKEDSEKQNVTIETGSDLGRVESSLSRHALLTQGEVESSPKLHSLYPSANRVPKNTNWKSISF